MYIHKNLGSERRCMRVNLQARGTIKTDFKGQRPVEGLQALTQWLSVLNVQLRLETETIYVSQSAPSRIFRFGYWLTLGEWQSIFTWLFWSTILVLSSKKSAKQTRNENCKNWSCARDLDLGLLVSQKEYRDLDALNQLHLSAVLPHTKFGT